MMIRRSKPRKRRGAALVEAAVLYPTFLMLLLGILVTTLGMFRHGQLSSLSWEAARWASVRGKDYREHGPDFTNDKTFPAPTETQIAQHIDPKLLFGFNVDPSKLDATLAPELTTVALGYDWKPQYNPPIEEKDPSDDPPKRVFDPVIHLQGASKMPTLRFRTD